MTPWARATVPWWMPRIVLLAGWFGAVAVTEMTDLPACTAIDPAVCGPDVSFAWAAVALIATPILLWWLPLAGCGAGIVFAALDLWFDEVDDIRLAFAVHGAACLAVACWTVVARRRQASIAEAMSSSVRLDAAVTERIRTRLSRWDPRLLTAVLLAAAGAAGVGWYAHSVDRVARHVDAAVRLDAVVVGVDQGGWAITVLVPGRLDRTDIDVFDAAPYPVGRTVPVLADLTGDRPWVRLVAEPADPTGWLAVGLTGIALAGLLVARAYAARVARRRLLDGPAPAVEMTLEPDYRGRSVLYVGADRHRVPVAVLQATEFPTDPLPDGREYAVGRSAPPLPWEAPPPRVVTVAGELRDGGWVMLLTDHSVLLPRTPLQAHHLAHVRS
jgi:hypothetical protein